MTTLLRLFVASLRRVSSRLRARLARKLAVLSRGAARLLAAGVPGGLAQRLCQVAVACGLAAMVAGGISTVAHAGGGGSTATINSYPTGTQSRPAVARDADGDAVVVWQSDSQDGSGWGIYARRVKYDEDGDAFPASPEFRVNTTTNGNQINPDVAMSAGGDFVVAWQSPDDFGPGIYAQRFNAEGVMQGPEFRVNGVVSGDQTRPKVSMDAAGNFVVVWDSFLQPQNNDRDVRARVYNADGTPRTAEFRVNTIFTGNQSIADVAMDADGQFIVVWNGVYAPGGSGYDVFAQRYQADGTPIGGEIVVNEYTSGDQMWPVVACDVDGDFVVAWVAYDHYYSYLYFADSIVVARRFDNTGNPVTGDIRVSENDLWQDNYQIAVSMDADGDFVLAWHSSTYYFSSWYSSPSSYSSWSGYDQEVKFRVYRADGSSVTGVNTAIYHGTVDITYPAVAMDFDGDFVIAWDDTFYGNDDIRARGYSTFTAYSASYDYDHAGPWVANLYVAGDHHRVTNGERLAQNTIDRLTVAFAEELDETAAGNAANYSLTRDGASVAINNVMYLFNQSHNRFEARLTLAAPLGDGDYVLTVRDTVTDLEGNALDGNFDGTPGGDYVINFTVNAARRQGGEFRVNTTTGGWQTRSDIAMDADGNYVVVWQGVTYSGPSSSYSHYDVYAQRYNASGAPQGAEFIVNTISTGDQKNPAVAMDADGNFIVVWDGYFDSNSYYSQAIIGRRFAADGTPLDPSDVFIEGGSYGQQNAAVAMDADGDFIVVWERNQYYYGDADIELAAFDADFNYRFGGIVNNNTSSHQFQPRVAVDADGDFIVVWTDTNPSISYLNPQMAIMAARFDRDGYPIQGMFPVDQWPVAFSFLPFPFQGVVQPDVAMDADGDFVVTWSEVGFIYGGSFYALGSNVKMARYHANGVPEDLFFQGTQVNDIPGQAFGASVSIDADGDFVVSWTTFHGYVAPFSSGSSLYGTEADVYVKRFNSQGQAQETDTRVNTYRRGNQQRSRVAMDADGDFVVVWTSAPSYFDQNAEQDGDGSGIYGQRFDMNARPTASGIPDQTMDEDETPRVINLASFFSDAEDGPGGLTYSIVGNTNGALVVPAIDGANLVLALVPDAHGTADISIRATDKQGLWVEDTFTLTVNQVDELVAFITKTKKERGCAADSNGAAPWGLLAVFAMLLGSLRGLARRRRS